MKYSCPGCAVGKEAKATEPTSCLPCPRNRYNDQFNSSCSDCPNGKVTADVGANVCQCGVGEMPDGSGGCSSCQSGFFKSTIGDVNCEACPANTDTGGQTGRAACGKYYYTAAEITTDLMLGTSHVSSMRHKVIDHDQCIVTAL